MTGPLPALAVCGSGLDGAANVSVAVATARGIAVAAAPAGARGDLAVQARRALAEAGITARDLRTVLVDRGPGSYIGLRVAVTFARCLASFAGAELQTVDSLAVAAAGAFGAGVDASARIGILLDGRQGRVQFGAYRRDGDRLTTIVAPRLAAVAELATLLQPGDALFADPGAFAAVAAIAPGVRALAPMRAERLFAAGLPVHSVAALELEPVYLTGSYAN